MAAAAHPNINKIHKRRRFIRVFLCNLLSFIDSIRGRSFSHDLITSPHAHKSKLATCLTDRLKGFNFRGVFRCPSTVFLFCDAFRATELQICGAFRATCLQIFGDLKSLACCAFPGPPSKISVVPSGPTSSESVVPSGPQPAAVPPGSSLGICC